MTTENAIAIIQKLRNENRAEDERFQDMTSALLWLRNELVGIHIRKLNLLEIIMLLVYFLPFIFPRILTWA